MSVVPKLEIIDVEEPRNGDSNRLASNNRSQRQHSITFTEIASARIFPGRVKSESSESNSQSPSSTRNGNSRIEMEKSNEITIESAKYLRGPIYCILCPGMDSRTFRDFSSLNEHSILRHGQPSKLVQCDLCPDQFLDDRNLQYHKYYDHIHNIKPFRCDQCPRSFGSADALKCHQGIHTEAGRKKIEEIRKRQAEEKRQKELKEEEERVRSKIREQRQRQRRRRMDNIESSPEPKKSKTIEQNRSRDKEKLESVSSTSTTTTTTMRELLIVCFLCPRCFESEQTMNLHFKDYHRVEPTEI